jgi:ABC-type branched-subunit amino acid transport system ATPase component
MALLEVKNLTKRFGGLTAVDNLSFEAKEGEILSIIGPNGAGKTTVFNCICALFPITQGSIQFNGTMLADEKTQLHTHQIAQLGIGRTFQIVKPLKELSVLENVMVGAFAHTGSRAEAQSDANRILDWIGLSGYKDKRARELTLSGRKRLEVARALATRPKIILLDEVMAGLNPTEVEEMIKLILRMRDEYGIAAACGVEHVMRVVMTISDRIIVLNYGKLIAQGTPKEIATDPVVIGAYLGESYEVEGA